MRRAKAPPPPMARPSRGLESWKYELSVLHLYFLFGLMVGCMGGWLTWVCVCAVRDSNEGRREHRDDRSTKNEARTRDRPKPTSKKHTRHRQQHTTNPLKKTKAPTGSSRAAPPPERRACWGRPPSRKSRRRIPRRRSTPVVYMIDLDKYMDGCHVNR